jgi:hypothetical protein
MIEIGLKEKRLKNFGMPVWPEGLEKATGFRQPWDLNL